MKEKIIIRIHSAIDLITNSSTEIFIIDKSNNVTVDIINAAIKEKFPDCDFKAYVTSPEWFYEYDYNIDEYIRKLRLLGYKIEAPKNIVEPEEIHISCERGEMSSEFIKFIRETFNGEYETS